MMPQQLVHGFMGFALNLLAQKTSESDLSDNTTCFQFSNQFQLVTSQAQIRHCTVVPPTITYCYPKTFGTSEYIANNLFHYSNNGEK